MSLLQLMIRVVLSYLVLLLLTRMMGRKEISQMTFFNFVSAITIGAIGGAVVIDRTVSLRNGIAALIAWSILTIVLGWADIRSKAVHKAIEGNPVVIIKDGNIMEHTLRKLRLSVDALSAILREKNVFSFSEVAYAIFETDGEISVMKKENQQPVTREDMHIQKEKIAIFPVKTKIVSDGMVDKEGLSKLSLDEKWLNEQLRKAGIPSVSDVFYAEVQPDGLLYIDKKRDGFHP